MVRERVMAQGRYPEIAEEELVLGALLGDLGAYDELVRRFRGAVLAVAEQALGCREGAEDVAQEAFLLAFKALPQLDEPARFPAWLCSITRHRARRIARGERRSEATEPSVLDRLLLEHSAELGIHPDRDLERREAESAMAEALDRLPPEHRILLRLRYFEEWRVARIAEFLSLPETTVKWRLHAGRKLLRRELETRLETCPGNGEKKDERARGTEDGAPADPPDAAPVGRNGARRLADRQLREGRAGLRAPVQLHPAPPGAAG